MLSSSTPRFMRVMYPAIVMRCQDVGRNRMVHTLKPRRDRCVLRSRKNEIPVAPRCTNNKDLGKDREIPGTLARDSLETTLNTGNKNPCRWSQPQWRNKWTTLYLYPGRGCGASVAGKACARDQACSAYCLVNAKCLACSGFDPHSAPIR